MSIGDLLHSLGYDASEHFLHGRKDLSRALDYGHVFRKAIAECSLRGVYTIGRAPSSSDGPVVPCVYVCEAEDEARARQIHRRVWNQNVVPFLLVYTPQTVRVYSGFRYERPESVAPGDTLAQGILRQAIAVNEVTKHLGAFRAEAIDDGSIWNEWGDQVTPETRVDWRLLDRLKALGDWLRDNGLESETAHALIGKFVYLRYLRDRGIVSDRKLAKWGIDPKRLFSRHATLAAFRRLEDALEDWLNGSLFPISGSDWPQVRAEHLRRVAGTFSGDDPLSGQLHLDFEPYDFSHIPIETLSNIYEQFLHVTADGAGHSRGKSAGAYYTPIPLVNFILEELNDKHPLRERMRVLDPACGSGTFLVQCYRRLVEQRRVEQAPKPLRPVELRDLLQRHVFGVDRDVDACRVAELSLILTLLDYVAPPDLEDNKHRFKLPVLRDKNIFCADFFAPDSAWTDFAQNASFDWVVGNPPWTELRSSPLSQDDQFASRWIQEHDATHPVGGNQLAEAFAWKVQPYVAPDGAVGLLLPAMTLFKDESTGFRREVFRRNRVWCVANFSNLAYVLFRGSESPAAAFFFRLRSEAEPVHDGRETILTYAPLVANQQANRPARARRRKKTWNIVINANEVREVPLEQAATGSMLPWKVAMWGSHYDYRLLQRLEGRFATLQAFAKEHDLKIHEGFQLRNRPDVDEVSGEESDEDREWPVEPTVFVEELVGQATLDFTRLRNCGRIFAFPERALTRISKERAHVRRGREVLPMLVSRPPHVIVDASRRFAVYSDEFIAVPARQIGIAGQQADADLLRALSLYLSSDFTTYHQFIRSPEWGVSSNRGTLNALRSLPAALPKLSTRDFRSWLDLHQRLVDAHQSARSDKPRQVARELLQELNDQVYDLLGLRERERSLVEDLVRVRMPLVKGKVSPDVVKPPSREQIVEYLNTFQTELDGFVEAGSDLRHEVVAVCDDRSAMIAVELVETNGGKPRATILRADDGLTRQFEGIHQDLCRTHSQWIYVNRGLRIYENQRTYVLKPMQRMLWTQSNALLDADELIAETLAQDLEYADTI